jgi:hypothetical protein
MTENDLLKAVRAFQQAFAEGDLFAGQQLGEIIVEHGGDSSALGAHLAEVSPIFSTEKYIFLQTPTYFWVGKVVLHGTHGIVLSDAAWVRDTGEDPGAMFREGNWASGYAVPGVHAVSRLAIMNVIPWQHDNKPWKQAE